MVIALSKINRTENVSGVTNSASFCAKNMHSAYFSIVGRSGVSEISVSKFATLIGIGLRASSLNFIWCLVSLRNIYESPKKTRNTN